MYWLTWVSKADWRLGLRLRRVPSWFRNYRTCRIDKRVCSCTLINRSWPFFTSSRRRIPGKASRGWIKYSGIAIIRVSVLNLLNQSWLFSSFLQLKSLIKKRICVRRAIFEHDDDDDDDVPSILVDAIAAVSRFSYENHRRLIVYGRV